MSELDNSINRTLSKNNIANFVLRIDFIQDNETQFEHIISKLEPFFDRTEKRIIEGFSIEINENKPSVNKAQDFEHVFVSESKNVTVTFTKSQSAFWIETTAYEDSSTYLSILSNIHNALSSDAPNIIAKRIGMRFINDFPCKEMVNIKKILNTENTKILNGLLKDQNLSRAIAFKEFNMDGKKARLQLGVANKFYPSVVRTYDVIVDIDVFFDLHIPLSDWRERIKELNHCAYDLFIRTINPKYLEKLK